MNALSPFSSLIAPPPAGRTLAGAGLVAPIATVEAPEGFAGWLPAAAPSVQSSTSPSVMLAGTAIGTGLTNAAQAGSTLPTPPSPSRSAQGMIDSAPTDVPAAIAVVAPAPSVVTPAAPPAPKPIGNADTADLRLPMVSITVSPTSEATTRSFVPKTMPISDAMPSGAILSPSTVPDAVDAKLVTAKAPSKVPLTSAATLPEPIPAVADPAASEATTDKVMDAAPADPSSPPDATAGRKARTAKPAEDLSAAPLSPVPVDAVLPLPPAQPVAAPAPQTGVTESDGDGQEHSGHAVAGRPAPVAQAAAGSAPVAGAASPMPAADAATAQATADPAAPTGEAKPAGKAVASDPTPPEHVAGEARPGAPAPSFRTQVDAVQQATKPAPAQPAQPAPPVVPVVQASHIGHDTAVAIARHVAQDGGETMTIRIAPAELGRIEVRLAFDDGGTLRATVAADQPASLDLLRRDTDSLVRALGDAGVRADSDSLRFDTRADTGGSTGGFASSGQSGSGGGQGRRTPFSAGPYATLTAGDEPAAEARTVSPRGRVDLMA